MEKVKLIYNPVSGNGHFEHRLTNMLAELRAEGLRLDPHRLSGKEDMENAVIDVSQGGYSSIMVAGGDGTVNSLVNKMMDFDIDLPVYIVPAGTANVISRDLGHSTDTAEIASTLKSRKLRGLDIGKANDVYFANVLAAGFPSNVAHEVETRLKNSLGMLAYFIKGMQQLTDLKSFEAKLTLPDRVIHEDLLLLLVLNTIAPGRLLRFAPSAKVDDGLLDIVLVKACAAQDLLGLFLKVVQGSHINDDRFVYLQSNEFSIECSDGTDTDVDGELGPRFPLNISVQRRRISVFEPVLTERVTPPSSIDDQEALTRHSF